MDALADRRRGRGHFQWRIHAGPVRLDGDLSSGIISHRGARHRRQPDL